jgi:hypothetical protein
LNGSAAFQVKGKSKWLNVLDTLSDIPFIVPTVALGYSLLLFWSQPDGISGLFGYSLLSPGWTLVILLHFAFSFPVVVRVVVGSLLDYPLLLYGIRNLVSELDDLDSRPNVKQGLQGKKHEEGERMTRFNFIPFGLTLESSPVQRIRSSFLFIAFDILNFLGTPQFGTSRLGISP